MKNFTCTFLAIASVLMPNYCIAQKAPSVQPDKPARLVTSLYNLVVERHPLGIPQDEEMKVFEPYISRRLLHQIDLSKACFTDWHRLNPDVNTKPTVGMLENGIFSGANEKAAPVAFSVEKAELRKDGTTLVTVKLAWSESGEKPLVWHVAAVVTYEHSRPVVDDVFFFKSKGKEIETRLSKALLQGCNGPHWVGSRP